MAGRAYCLEFARGAPLHMNVTTLRDMKRPVIDGYNLWLTYTCKARCREIDQFMAGFYFIACALGLKMTIFREGDPLAP